MKKSGKKQLIKFTQSAIIINEGVKNIAENMVHLYQQITGKSKEEIIKDLNPEYLITQILSNKINKETLIEQIRSALGKYPQIPQPFHTRQP